MAGPRVRAVRNLDRMGSDLAVGSDPPHRSGRLDSNHYQVDSNQADLYQALPADL